MAELVVLSSVRANDIEKLLDDAFGPDRHQRTAYLLRRDVAIIDYLSFAVRDRDTFIGSIQCWPVQVGNAPLILVGPVAVSPQYQNQGIGHLMMHTTLGVNRPGDAPMIMIGNPEYYGRFGFVAEQTGGWTLPGPWEPHRLLARNPLKIALPVNGIVGPRKVDTGL